MKTVIINDRTFEVVTAPKMVEKILELDYCGGLSIRYTNCSSNKQAIYDNWAQYFRDIATGHCSFGVSSANCHSFTICCDIELCLEEDDFYSRPYRMYITPSHNYLLKIAD